jgi:ParB-like chromosome segregation protein Spo0J
MKSEIIKLYKIKSNPDNPRLIKDDKFHKLVKSIKEFPEMLKIRPIVVNEDLIVLGGNMRLKACKEAGLKEVHIIKASEFTAKQQREFIVKDNVGFGEWDWNMIANEWDTEQLDDWGLDLPLGSQIDNLEDDEEIELPQSVQLEPPKEYILIMAEPNSVEWEELKESLKLKMVKNGGYKKGSPFESASIERVLWWDEFKKRINDNSSTE